MRIRYMLSILLAISLFAFTQMSEYGIEKPGAVGPYLNEVFPNTSPAFGDWKAVNAFPNLTFVDPIAMVQVPNEDAYYVAGKPGLLWLVENEQATEKSVALDISDLVITSGDGGFINFVLHPEFGQEGSPNKGYAYLYYPHHPHIPHGNDPAMNRISRFTLKPNSLNFDPASELILIQDYDPQAFHMGGGMFFDEEGFLYIAFGDGGGGDDEFNSSQQIDQRFWGGLIRIDVDNDASRSHPIRRKPIEFPGRAADLPASFNQGYMIPNDNPWQSEDSSVLEEFYGLGLRNPHRAAYDPVEKTIWIGDVGQGKYEEVTVMPKGGNAQWPFKEGKGNGIKPFPATIIGQEVTPVYDYGRWDGEAIIGGYVYRGARWSQYLDGLYLFGDNGTQNIWSFNPNTRETKLITQLPQPINGHKSGLSSFGTNEAGDIFALSLFGENKDGGIIYKLVVDEAPAPNIPTLLSEVGAFSDLVRLIPAQGLVPYKTNSPLWSDGALKKRWIALPNDGKHNSPKEQITFADNDEWQFPSGTVFIKHFDLPLDKRDLSKTRKLETRFFILDKEGQGYGLTYKWNDEGTDAVLLETDYKETYEVWDELGQKQEQTWEYPSRLQCMNCHNANANFVLGAQTWQLNGDLQYPTSGITANQLATWNHLGMFTNGFEDEAIASFPKASPIDDESSTLQHRVLSYLDANCAHCHRPEGVNGAFDARFSTRMLNKNLIGALGISHNTPNDGKIIKAGSPEHSQLWIRDKSIDFNKMPPLSKRVVDQPYIDVLTAWINTLGDDCEGDFISDLDWVSATNGEGPVERDRANGYAPPRDGKIITIAGKQFTKGLGTRANAEIEFDLNAEYVQFNTYIGIDDRTCDDANVYFEVYVDGELRYESPVMKKGLEPRFVSVDIRGAHSLRLLTQSRDGSQICDQADWANARLLRVPDSDGDGICDEQDICPGFDDRQDINNDGVPDGCENIFTPETLNMSVLPTPFTEYTDIILTRPDASVKPARLAVYDLSGRVIHQDFQVDYGMRYALGYDWQVGVYVIVVKAGKYENRMKVVKLE